MSQLIKLFTILIALFFVFNGTSLAMSSSIVESKSKLIIVKASEVKWEDLNPARGGKSPKAATLWGSRIGEGPSGFLLRPVDGFKSPPHIHNTAYRGVVIEGLFHNDDPNADEMYMSKGSFWTQPEGGVHVTAAKGANNLAYIEVEDAFGVLPSEEAFESKNKPLNIDASNIVWVESPNHLNSNEKIMVSYLWGMPQKNQLHGLFVRIPRDVMGQLKNERSLFRAVLIQGQIQHSSNKTSSQGLEPGSYIASTGKISHRFTCIDDEESCIIYVRTNGMIDIS